MQQHSSTRCWVILIKIFSINEVVRYRPELLWRTSIRKNGDLFYALHPCIRVDTGVQAGSSIVASYDSMIAKLIVKGKTGRMLLKTVKWLLIRFGSKALKQLSRFFGCSFAIRSFRTVLYNFIYRKDLDKYYFNSEYEEMLAAWLATKLFVEENLNDDSINVNFEHGKVMSPWLLNKRINQF